MTTTLFNPRWHAFDDDGEPYPLALLHIYEAGTTTRVNSYSDKEGTIAHTNPIVADPGGRFARIFLDEGSYKLVLEQADGTNIWTEDYYYTVLDAESPINVSGLPFRIIKAEAMGKLTDAELFSIIVIEKSYLLKAQSSETIGVCDTAATGAFTVTLSLNDVSVATFTWAAAGTSATVVGPAADTPMAVGDILKLTGPATADATAADFAFSITLKER